MIQQFRKGDKVVYDPTIRVDPHLRAKRFEVVSLDLFETVFLKETKYRSFSSHLERNLILVSRKANR